MGRERRREGGMKGGRKGRTKRKEKTFVHPDYWGEGDKLLYL